MADRGGFVLRPARREEAARLTSIALESKGHWGYPPAWLESWRETLTVSEDYIANFRVVVAAGPDDQPLGFYGLIQNREPCQLDLLYVRPRAIGRGVGAVLFRHAVERARVEGRERMTIDADPNAAGFYERMGAVRYGEVPAAMDDTPRVRPQYRVELTE